MILLWTISGSAQNALDTLLYWSDQEIPTDTAQIDKLNSYIYRHYRTYPELTKRIGRKIADKAKAIDYNRGLATSLRRIGGANYVLGKTAELIESQQEAIIVYQNMGDKRGVAYCWNNIGLAYMQIDELPRAKDTFFKALNAMETENYEFMGICYNNLGLVYNSLEDYDSSLYYNNLALDIRLTQSKDERRLQATYNNLGLLNHQHLGNTPEGINYMLKSIEINLKIKNYVDLAGSYINLGNMYKDLGNYTQSLANYELAIQYADSSQDQSTLSEAYKVASTLEVEYGKTDNSLAYFQKYHEAELRSIENKQETDVKRLENNFTVIQKEKELADLRTEQASQRIIQIYLIAGMVIAILLIILIVLIMRSRIRKVHVQREKLKQELDHKNKELTSYALNFIQKNDLIDQFSKRIEEIRKDADSTTSRELSKVGKMLNDSSRIDNEWENFKMRFEEVHTGFFPALQHAFPNISNAEIRLCALLLLNMNLKESSRILGISSDSVKTARHRLRKKLGLQKDENLVTFLMQFDKEMVA